MRQSGYTQEIGRLIHQLREESPKKTWNQIQEELDIDPKTARSYYKKYCSNAGLPSKIIPKSKPWKSQRICVWLTKGTEAADRRDQALRELNESRFNFLSKLVLVTAAKHSSKSHINVAHKNSLKQCVHELKVLKQTYISCAEEADNYSKYGLKDPTLRHHHNEPNVDVREIDEMEPIDAYRSLSEQYDETFNKFWDYLTKNIDPKIISIEPNLVSITLDHKFIEFQKTLGSLLKQRLTKLATADPRGTRSRFTVYEPYWKQIEQDSKHLEIIVKEAERALTPVELALKGTTHLGTVEIN